MINSVHGDKIALTSDGMTFVSLSGLISPDQEPGRNKGGRKAHQDDKVPPQAGEERPQSQSSNGKVSRSRDSANGSGGSTHESDSEAGEDEEEKDDDEGSSPHGNSQVSSCHGEEVTSQMDEEKVCEVCCEGDGNEDLLTCQGGYGCKVRCIRDVA